jgi:caffeoyl-CoA O-methyltransferase
MNRRTAVFLGVALLAAAAVAVTQQRGRRAVEGPKPPLAANSAEQRILAVLDEVRRSGRTWASVPDADGRLLRVLAEAAGAKHIAEIGTSTGYSGLWFSLALQATGGRLTTFEIDPGRAAMAREHFKKAGVDHLITLIEGDAHQTLARLQGPIDLAFIDAEKSGYVDYLEKLLPLVRPGGLILAHNVEMAPDYVRAVTSNPALETVFYMEGAGLGVTLKKR